MQPHTSTAQPLFSVLIGRVSTEDGQRILETLQSLQHQDAALTCEVIVVDRLQDEVSATIRSRFPNVLLLPCDAYASLPAMRTQALGAARGRYVAVTEDHCVPSLSWLRDFKAVIDEHPDAAAVAGCVENGVTERTLDWATFLCEYAAFAPPIAEGPSTSLAGMNVVYDRRALEACPQELLSRGFWETTVHPQLDAQGKRLLATNRVRIVHSKRFSFRLFAVQRYLYSRYYAGIRFAGQRPALRFAAALATPLLPALLTFRLVRAARRKASISAPALRAVPYLLVFFVIWAFGEAVGYLRGPGESLRAIE
jgi:hypothetical protein